MSAGAASTDSGPSRTSQAVAVTRAEFARPVTPRGDPLAQSRLCAGMGPAVMHARVPSLRARTRFFDEEVLRAIAAGVTQVVILGAGYDDRALRFRSAGVRFIEIDHPATQDDKARRLAEIGAGEEPTLAPADFEHDDVVEVLRACGHDAGLPSLFMCEGLLAYLDQPTIIRLLGGVHARAFPRSALAASLAIHADGIDSVQYTTAANKQRRAGTSEPWRTILPANEHVSLLTHAGWLVDRAVDQSELDGAAPAGRSLLVVARAG
jgi:methyltransferase (TIGR00027 family)